MKLKSERTKLNLSICHRRFFRVKNWISHIFSCQGGVAVLDSDYHSSSSTVGFPTVTELVKTRILSTKNWVILINHIVYVWNYQKFFCLFLCVNGVASMVYMMYQVCMVYMMYQGCVSSRAHDGHAGGRKSYISDRVWKSCPVFLSGSPCA